MYEPGSIEFRDRDGGALDLHRSFTLDDPPEEIGHFLAEAGFLHLEGCSPRTRWRPCRPTTTPRWPPPTPTTAPRGGRAPSPASGTRPGSSASTTRPPTLRELLHTDRFRSIGTFTDDSFVQRDPEATDAAEGLLKKVGVVEGVSDVSWHKDCSMGGHSRGCCGLVVGISVTGAERENGELGVVAGRTGPTWSPSASTGSTSRACPCRRETGDVTVHCSCTLHMSRPPISAERRVVYTGFGLAPRAGDHRDEVDPAEQRRQRAAQNDHVRRNQREAGLARAPPASTSDRRGPPHRREVCAVNDIETTDFFRSNELLRDPYPYFEELRARCPVQREPHHGVVMITGYEEALAVYNDTATFSSCTSVSGPFPGFPVPLEGDDISALIDEHRHELPMNDQITTMDPPVHSDHRALLMRLITPKRLKENEEFMWRLADQQLDSCLADGRAEYITQFANPFAMLVVADLLGVPEEDFPRFTEALLSGSHDRGAIGSTGTETLGHTPLEYLYEAFTTYVEDRRRNPRDDVLTGLATATFPDGSTPEVIDVVRIASNLFAAGQETTVRLLSSAVQMIAEQPDLQARLRGDRSLLPNFVEECLRMESPIKGDFRLSRVPTTVGGVDLPAGTTVMLVNAAVNRDPRQFEDPASFQVDRPNARTHVAFGRGIHSCPGSPLARAEARISLERLLDRTSDIRIDEEHHGPPDARRYDYVPTFILRGLTRLHIEFTPLEPAAR